MSRMGDGGQLPSSGQCEQGRKPGSVLPQSLCTCSALCPERSHPGFACLLSHISRCHIFRGLPLNLLEKGHSPPTVLSISSPCFIFPPGIHLLLPETLPCLAPRLKGFTRARILCLEQSLGMTGAQKILAE